LQECWLRIHKARHTYRPGSPVLPWLFAIARHTRVDGWRRISRSGRLRELSLDDLPTEPRAPKGKGLSALELKELLAGLPENQSDVVYMMKVLGMSLEETARATGSTVGGVKQRAHRAYERLRVMLRDQGYQRCH
jgi:RNA polymerase sigma-70 factor (ECF subfamily)